MEVPRAWLSNNREADYLRTMPDELPTVEWVWREMDRVWDEFGLDNRRALSGQPIADFYRHPVWLMNGLFTAADPESWGHRRSIAAYLAAQPGIGDVADYGGGFGELALAVTSASSNIRVSIIEPFPSKAGLERMWRFSNVDFVDAALPGRHDAVVAEDVLEHVEDPVGLAFELSSAVRSGGMLIFANCFYPVIACHLPGTFHLRHTFTWVMRHMGLAFVGHVPGAPHAVVYRRSRALHERRARRAEKISRRVGPVLNFAARVVRRLRRFLR